MDILSKFRIGLKKTSSFLTSNIMHSLTSKQISLADKFTIKHEPISSIKLMERAASCGYKIIRELLKLQRSLPI